MKTIKYILILFCATVGLLAQDKEPEPMEFIWGNTNTLRVFDPTDSLFIQKEFLIGTQWGHTPKYFIGMNHNAGAGRFGKHSLDYMYEKPIMTIDQPHVGINFVPFRISPAMHYDPALSVEALINPDTLINDTSIAKDPTFSVFGFKERKYGYVEIDDFNNRRLRMDTSSSYSDTTFILSSISEQPRFTTGIGFTSQNGGYYGHRWFISVNMRKLSNVSRNNNSKLITLKIKYKKRHNNKVEWDYINYDSIPCISADYYDLPWERGRQQRMQKYISDSATPMKEFTITSDMFEANRDDITFSASFLTMKPHIRNEYDSNRYQINPEFTNGGFRDTFRIEDLDIEVYYHNSASIAIDYIKIESENAFYMSRGYLDEMPEIQKLDDKYLHVIANYNYNGNKFDHIKPAQGKNPFPYDIWSRPFAIKEIMQKWIDNNKKVKLRDGTVLYQPLRFYIQDTESDKPHFWWQLRYANLITNGLAVTRDLPYKHKLYKYYTKARNRYIGIKIQENENMVPSPAIQFGHGGDHGKSYFMNLKYGYSIDRGNEDQAQWGITATEQDTLISANPLLYSNYETYLNLNYRGLPVFLKGIFYRINWRNYCRKRLFDIARYANLNDSNEKKVFNEIVKQSGSIQIRWENSLRDKFYNHQDMLYSDDAWWMNYFFSTDYHQHRVNGVDIPQFSGWRYKTGEETRLLLYGSILKGAKGFFYDRECDSPYLISTGKYTDILGIGFGNKIIDNDLINLKGSYYPRSDFVPFDQYQAIANEHVGNDFLNPDIDPSKMYSCIESVSKKIADTLGVAQDRIYLGMRSTRTEVYKISQLIRRLEQNKRRNPSVYPHDLMDLCLVAWYGKGFTEMYSQHPKYNDGDLMYKTGIPACGFLTAKLYQPYRDSCVKNVNDSLDFIYREDIDSSFFDVTILVPKDYHLPKLFSYYIGIQNRRTDPLIWDIDSKKMKFYSTAELEDKCNSRNTDTNYYQDLFWKRLGCRLISFLIIHKPLLSVQIEEVLSQDTAFNNTNARWRSDKYCHKINYYHCTNHFLFNNILTSRYSIKFLPGEGKLLRVSYYSKIPNVSNYSDGTTCPGSSDLYLNYKLVSQKGDSLVYDIELVNNTKNELKDLPILYKFLSDDVNINLNEFINHSNLHPDCYDENKLKRVSIIDSVSPQGNRQIARIKVDKKAGLPELVYRFDVLSKDGKPCDQVFINSDNHIKEYYGKGYKGKKSHKYQPDFVSSLEVNPNPANDKLTVSFASSEVSSYKLRIYDINGSMVYSQANNISNFGTNELILDISTLPVGVYNLSLDINNSKISKKFSIDR